MLFWKIRRAYELAVGDDGLKDIGRLLVTLAHDGIDVATTVLAWVDLVETVVQDTEQEFSRKPGSGAAKKERVRAVLAALVTRSPLVRLAPDFFTPTVIWAATSLIVDAVVRVLNGRGLWLGGDAEGRAAAPDWRVRIAAWFVRVFARLYTFGQKREALSREVEAAVDRVLAVHPIDVSRLLGDIGDVLNWIGAHQAEVAALVDMVSAASDQAELFGTLDGPGKKRYARNLIIVFVETEFGRPEAQLLQSGLGSWLLDIAIDGIVLVLRKRGAYRPGEVRTPPAASVALKPAALAAERRAMPGRAAT